MDIPYSAFSPSYPIATPRKHWYDKVADAILGEDDSAFASPSSRYALICEKCFTHNGLVKESMWEDAREFSPPLFSVPVVPLGNVIPDHDLHSLLNIITNGLIFSLTLYHTCRVRLPKMQSL